MDESHAEILNELAEIKGDLKAIGCRLESGAKTMDDHELRIRTNKEDINGIAENGRIISNHLKELNENLKEIKPFSDFLRGFAKLAAFCAILAGGVYAVFQMFPKGKTQ